MLSFREQVLLRLCERSSRLIAAQLWNEPWSSLKDVKLLLSQVTAAQMAPYVTIHASLNNTRELHMFLSTSSRHISAAQLLQLFACLCKYCWAVSQSETRSWSTVWHSSVSFTGLFVCVVVFVGTSRQPHLPRTSSSWWTSVAAWRAWKWPSPSTPSTRSWTHWGRMTLSMSLLWELFFVETSKHKATNKLTNHILDKRMTTAGWQVLLSWVSDVWQHSIQNLTHWCCPQKLFSKVCLFF